MENKIIMAYREQITPWVVVRLLPNFRHVDIARFYKLADAEAYAQILRQLSPAAKYTVMYDATEKGKP